MVGAPALSTGPPSCSNDQSAGLAPDQPPNEQQPVAASTPKNRGKTRNKDEPHWLTLEEEKELPYNSRWAVMTSLMLCVFTAALDQSIVAPALPTIAAELHANAAGYSYVCPFFPFSSFQPGLHRQLSVECCAFCTDGSVQHTYSPRPLSTLCMGD